MTRNPSYPADQHPTETIVGYHSIEHGAGLWAGFLLSPEDNCETELQAWISWRNRQSKTKASEARQRGSVIASGQLGVDL